MGLERDDALAFAYLSKAASQNHAESQYFLGIMYRDGKVPPSVNGRPFSSTEVAQHKKEALRLFRQSASQSIHAAFTETATCYEKGVGTTVNHATASQYYEKAISISGNCLPSAQLTYATFLHKTGKYQKALQLYFLAAGLQPSPLNTHSGSDSIVRTSKLMIALFYLDEKDTTTPYKPKEAFDMLISLTQEATAQSGEVHYWIAVCYEEGVSGVVKSNLSKSFDHYLTSAKLGYSNSQFQVGHMLCKGLGVKEDRLAAFDWLQAAAKQKHANALYYVGIYYYNGSGSIARNLDYARDYFKQSAELGNVESMVSYAQICYEKVNENALPASEIEKLQQESIRWYKKAAHLNHPTSLRELGRIYGANKDYKISAEYFEKAAKLNDALSTVILGGYYENGHGVAMNKQTALAYYEKAIELGQPT
jgi:TPR repeat protein